MAYEFGTTGTTDVVTTAYNAFNTLSTFSAWVYARSDGPGDAGSVFRRQGSNGTTSTCLGMNIIESSSTLRFLRQWNGDAATNWTAPLFSLNAWHHVAVTYDSGSSANDPLMYIDGTSQTVTEVAPAPTGTINNSDFPMLIGNRADSLRNWDGYLAEFACWNRILSANDIVSLSKGFSPLCFQAGMTCHVPLIRNNTDLINPGTVTTTGTTIVAHPPIKYPDIS